MMLSKEIKGWIIAVFIAGIAVSVYFALNRADYKTVKIDNQAFEEPPVPESFPEFNAKERKFLEKIDKDPRNPELQANLGDIYFENNRFEQAVERYRKVLELNPSDVDTYNDLGLALHYTGRSGNALDTLKKGVKVDPSYQRIWLSLGFVLASAGRNEEARKALNTAVDLAPGTDIGKEAKKLLLLLK